MTTLEPPFTSASNLASTMQAQGFAVLDAQTVQAWAGVSAAQLSALVPSWDRLAADQYLKDGGRYRKRRHSSHIVSAAGATLAEHRAHWQPLEYNALHGGMRRWFEPVEAKTIEQAGWAALLRAVASAATGLRGARTWFVEAHQFRIDTADGIGRPTPEGAHRDGVDLVAVFLVSRHQIRGGETRVFDAKGPMGQRFTLSEPWSVLLLDDERVIHESTPIQPDADDPAQCWRDTLVLTCRRDEFLGG